MQITFVGHASILVDAGGVTVLSDPWWNGPCFGAQWWTYPEPFLQAVGDNPIDYIYISHGHHDHFHPGTLGTLPRTAKVLVSSSIGLAEPIRELGFEVIEIHPDQSIPLGKEGLTARIIPTHGDDTLMILADGNEVCVNLNDALHSASKITQDKFIRQLRLLHPKIDYVFCGYGTASHFPNCYVIPGKDAAATAAKRQAYFNRQWCGIVSGLEPHFAFPFAANVVLLQNELFWANEPVHNAERPTDVFKAQNPGSTTQVVDIAPGFKISDKKIITPTIRQPLEARRLLMEMSDQIERANRVGQDSEALIADTVIATNANLSNCHDFLATFDGDYRIALRFINSKKCLLLDKTGAGITLRLASVDEAKDVDMFYTTRWAYLRWALQRQYGDEILFVGSGGIFEYTTQAAMHRALHRELIALIRNQSDLKRFLPDRRQRIVVTLKRFLKQALGRNETDLYDLKEWIVIDRTLEKA